MAISPRLHDLTGRQSSNQRVLSDGRQAGRHRKAQGFESNTPEKKGERKSERETERVRRGNTVGKSAVETKLERQIEVECRYVETLNTPGQAGTQTN